jgi:hypothetical protein
MTIAPRRAGGVAAVWRVEIGRAADRLPCPLHPLEVAPACASLSPLLRAVHPRTEPAMDGCFHGSFTNVFDVKENVRVTPITSYNQRCIVLPFQTIVDAPCLSRRNRG